LNEPSRRKFTHIESASSSALPGRSAPRWAANAPLSPAVPASVNESAAGTTQQGRASARCRSEESCDKFAPRSRFLPRLNMRSSTTWRATLAILASLLAARGATGQAITGTIEGQVKDAQGAVLPGVVVTARNVETAAVFAAGTTSGGLYRLTYLPLGTYEVRAELPGFRTEIRQAVPVRLNETTVLHLVLNVAPIAEEVTVLAESPIIQTSKSEIRRTYDEKALLDRPLTTQVSGFAGRSVYNFATLAPGVTTPVRFDRAFLGSGGSNVIANGTTARSSNFELDGISNIDPEDNDYRVPVSVEGVREFEVITSNYNAEFGRAGGAQARAVSKSGSNTVHGSAYEFFFDNAAFNWPGNPLQQQRCSADEQRASAGRCYAEFTLNLFGATVGGPIRPNRAFFFGMFENNVRRGENFSNGLVPLATERTPATGSAAGDAIVREWLDLYPLPNRPDVNVRGFERNAPFKYDAPNPFGRIDLNISDKTKLMGRYDFRNQDFTIERVFRGNGGDIVDRAHTGGASVTRIFSANMVGEFRFGYAYRRVDLPTEQGFESFPTITTSGLSTLGATANQWPIFRKLYDYQGAGSIAYTRGRHALKAGYDLHRTFNNGIQSDFVRGLISFGTGYGRTGIQNLLAGTPTSYTVTVGDVERNFHYWDLAFFVQDDLKLRDNLTVNLGLRNESVTEWREKDGKTDFGYESSLVNLAPRVGAAYDVRGDGIWVVRGAYGLSYDRVNFFFLRSLQFQAPLTRTITLLPSGSEPLRVETLSPTSGIVSAAPAMKFDVDPEFELGRVHTWNVTLERDLFRRISARASYIGSASRGLPSTLILNRAEPVAGATVGNRQARRPDPTIGNHQRLANASDGNYHGLQVSLQQRQWKGLQYQLSYTYSKAQDLASDVGFASGDLWLSMAWDADLRFARDGDRSARKTDLYGPSRFDQRTVFSFNFSYDTPWRRRPGVLGAVLSDWQVAGTSYYRDGYPINVTCGANAGDCNIDGVAQDRPNVVDESVVGQQFRFKPQSSADTQIQHILPTAFDQNIAPGGAGTLGRNQFRTDDFLTVDLAIVRSVYFGAAAQLQLRLEIYNVFNNTFAGAPSLSLATLADFGKISSVGGNRSLQLAAKLYW
jgi:Carboxypeptidase regulatory-like domain